MTLGPGRMAKKPEILSVRPATREEVLGCVRASNMNDVKALKDSHHRVARLVALGLRTEQVAMESGYSIGRVSTLKASPAFQELVASYRAVVDDEFATAADEYYSTVAANRIIAARRLNDMLSDDEKQFTPAQLVSIHADAADRTGYPKRSVAVNVNVDFAAKLDQAVRRSKEVQAPRLVHPSPTVGGGEGAQRNGPEVIDAEPPLRRAV